MLLGKFMPPHNGHVYLADFASNYVDELAIVVCSLEREPIPGALRYQWMRELFPRAHVVHLTDDLPQEPKDHPDFWRLWQKALERILPFAPDYVFASEAYGAKLAEVQGARFVPVDPARAVMAVSGTKVRTDPMGNWQHLPRCVRPYFVRRVCVFGPESTGKSTLAQRLAQRFGTVAVPEYARTLLESQGGKLDESDIPRIAQGQAASEDALAFAANRVLICDTDVLTTVIWSETLFGSCPETVREQADRRGYHLYLLNDVDVPWVSDPVRYLPLQRAEFFQRCRAELEERKRRYVILQGDWEQRFEVACRAVEEVIGERRP
jgi:NadR type nicotinamide-nucleotide adenylyltransferase